MNTSRTLHETSSADLVVHEHFGIIFPSALNTLPEQPRSKASILPLFGFIQEINDAERDIEEVAEEYLQLYGQHCKLIVDAKDVHKLLPNITIKGGSKLLKLYGLEPVDLNDQKSTKYSFHPHSYIHATMVNSVSYKNFANRIKFAFRVYDEDDDGNISRAFQKSQILWKRESICT